MSYTVIESSKIKYLWEDCVVSFICPICKREHIADSQNGECICECGAIYQLHAYVTIKIPEIGTDLPLTK